jgi:hypothetical protein
VFQNAVKQEIERVVILEKGEFILLARRSLSPWFVAHEILGGAGFKSVMIYTASYKQILIETPG